MKRPATIDGFFNKEQLADYLVHSGGLASCSSRSADSWAKKYAHVMPASRRGGRVFFKIENAVALAGGIKSGRYTLSQKKS